MVRAGAVRVSTGPERQALTTRFGGRLILALVAVCGEAALALMIGAAAASAQTAPAGATPAAQSGEQTAAPGTEAFDLIDLLRKIRHKELTPEQKAAAADPKARMRAIAPVIGYKPSTGATIGIAGNMARFFGDPATTRISSTVASLTFSTKNQTSVSVRLDGSGPGDRWSLDGDNRLQWTSQDTFGLGTTTPDDPTNMKFDYIRLYETAYRKVYRRLHAGVGFHYSTHTDIGPGEGAEAAWAGSPHVTYSERYGFDLESQTSAGLSANARIDSRNSAINPDRGWLVGVSYRPFIKDLLGGDSTWQELYLDTRTYRKLDSRGRHMLAFWLWGDMVTGESRRTSTCPRPGWTSTAAPHGDTPRGGCAGRSCSTVRSSTGRR